MKRVRGVRQPLAEAAVQLRRAMTPAEVVLWDALRGRKIGGLKFRRQHALGPYVLDFCCPERRLAIEVDGASHDDSEQRAYDADRDAHLATYGYRTLRFTNREVFADLTDVLNRILEAAEGPRPQRLGEESQSRQPRPRPEPDL
jgi:very-short-patch-repair endonuclease